MSSSFFPIAEFESRHDKIRAAMDDLGIDLLLVLAPSHVNYLIGTPAKGYQEFQALFLPREPGPLTLLTRLCEVPLFQAESLAEDIRGWGGREPEDPITAVKRVMEEKGWLARRIGIEVPDHYLHPYHHQKLIAVLGESRVTDATDLIGTVKLVKSAAEIEYVRKVAAILDAAMETCRDSSVVDRRTGATGAGTREGEAGDRGVLNPGPREIADRDLLRRLPARRASRSQLAELDGGVPAFENLRRVLQLPHCETLLAPVADHAIRATQHPRIELLLAG